MISMDVSHPDIEEFIDIKQDLNKVTKANISVKVNDEFMTAVRDNKSWILEFKTDANEIIKKPINARKLFMKLCERNWDYAEPGILYWSAIENYNILSEDKDFKYEGVNPCAEEPLPAGGSCLLGSFNLSAYVTNNQFDFCEFESDIHIVVEAMNEVLDEGLELHPLKIQQETVRDYRQIGIGVMGIADMLIKLGLKYGEEESIKLCDKIGFLLADRSLNASACLAAKHGAYPKYKRNIESSKFVLHNTTKSTTELIKKHGLRNSQILTIAPTGTLSTMLGISGGIEPIFENSYTRKTESLHGKDTYYKVYTPIVKEYMNNNGLKDEKELPDYFVTAMTLDPMKRVKMQGIWQTHIDASISSTVNLNNNATVEDVYNIYMEAWKAGLKGITIYRDGCARSGVLTLEEDKSNEKQELKRGDWKPLASDTYYVKRNLSIGCGKLKLFIGYSPKENAIQDLYIKKSGSGGCSKNLETTVIGISAALRLGGTIGNIEKAFSGVDSCPSFATARAKGIKLSKGSYCGSAIINEVYKFLKEIEGKENIEVVTQNNEIKKVDNKKHKNDNSLCPECGEKLAFSGGCTQCNSCGYTKCDL